MTTAEAFTTWLAQRAEREDALAPTAAAVLEGTADPADTATRDRVRLLREEFQAVTAELVLELMCPGVLWRLRDPLGLGRTILDYSQEELDMVLKYRDEYRAKHKK